VPSIFVSFVPAAGIAAFTGAVALTRDWQPVAPQHLGLLSATAGFLIVGYVYSIKAKREGEGAFVSPFRYTIMIWALLLGIAVFGEFPDAWTLAGAAIVVVMGIYTFYRERRLMLRAAVATPAASVAKPTAE
jgi:drug/metabolite transporter (DMT)-like permease